MSGAGGISQPVIGDFVPIKKYGDIGKRMKESGIAEEVLVAVPGSWGKKAARTWGGKITQKRAIEKANKILEGIHDIETRLNIKLPKVKGVFVTNSKRGAAHSIKPANEAWMTFANEWSDDAWKNIRAWEKKHNGKWDGSPEESHIFDNLRHEWGHVIDGDLGNKVPGAQAKPAIRRRLTDTDEFKAMQREVFKTDKFPSSKISEYAKTNSKEWFAEAFTQYTSKHYKGNFPKRLEKYLDSVLDNYRVD